MVKPGFVALLIASFVAGLIAPSSAHSAETNTPRKEAFLSCVSDIAGAPLQETEGDVANFAAVLDDYYDFNVKRYKNAVFDPNDASREANLRAFEKAFRDRASAVGAGDWFVAYLSGHMVVVNGELYYPISGYDANYPEKTACSAKTIAKIMNECKASVKLLILDCCHSGSEHWLNAFGANGDRTDFVTIASSKASEVSIIWNAKAASLFTYWLNFALRGYADGCERDESDNGFSFGETDGEITLKELETYLQKWVPPTAKALWFEQTPVVLNAELYPDLKLRPRARKINERLEELSELVATSLALEKATSNGRDEYLVGVPEFSTGAPDERKIDVIAGATTKLKAIALSDYMSKFAESLDSKSASSLYDKLRGDASNKLFSILPSERVDEILEKNKVAIGDLVRGVKSQELEAPSKRPIIVGGNLSFYAKAGARIGLSCVDVKGKVLLETSCRALVDAADLADAGVSANVQANAERPAGARERVHGTSYSTGALASMDQALTDRLEGVVKPHPLDTPDACCGVSFRTRKLGANAYDSKAIYPQFKDGDAFVEFDKDQEYAIDVENKSGSDVCVRITVDGRETLSQAPPSPDGKSPISDWNRVSIDSALLWFVEKDKTASFYGFVKPNPVNLKNSEMRRFVVRSTSGKQNERTTYSSELGLIIIEVFEAQDVVRGSGAETEMGEPETIEVKMVPKKRGTWKGKYVVRYSLKNEY